MFGESRFVVRVLVSGSENLSNFPQLFFLTDAVRDVFRNRSYWKRLWVVQECVLASETVFICGNRSFDMEMMTLMWFIIDGLHPIAGSGALIRSCDLAARTAIMGSVTAVFLTLYGKEFPDKSTLFNTMDTFSNRLCTEPRDNIYALLGVSLPLDVSVDYSKSISDIFVDATRAMICQERHTDLLCLTPASEVEVARQLEGLNFPSWVPHFEVWLQLSNLISPELSISIYKETWPLGDIECKAPADDKRILCLQGLLYETIIDTQGRLSLSHQIPWQEVFSLSGQNFYPMAHQ